MAQAISGLGTLNTYPEYFPVGLQKATEDFYGIPANQTIFVGGSDQAVELVLKAFSRKVDASHVMRRSYKHFEVFSQIHDTPVKHYSAAEFFELSDQQGIIYVVNPNNPTGEYYSLEKIQRLIDRNPLAIILIDEAYIEFSDQPSMIAKLQEHRNLIVIRTLSKAFGLASAKCGFLFASENMTRLLEQYHNKKSTGVFSNIAAELALKNTERMKAYVASVNAMKQRFYETLDVSRHSQTNFESVSVSDSEAFIQISEACGFVFRDLSKAYGIALTFRLTFPSLRHEERFMRFTTELMRRGLITNVGITNA